MKKTFLVLLTFIAATYGICSFADEGTYSGSNCVKWSGGIVKYGGHGAVYNNHNTQKAYVLCNLRRTDSGGVYGDVAEIDLAYFATIDKHNTQDVKCRFIAQNVFTSGPIQVFWGGKRSSDGYGTQRQRVDLPVSKFNQFSNVVLRCELPPKTANGVSKIYQYFVRQ